MREGEEDIVVDGYEWGVMRYGMAMGNVKALGFFFKQKTAYEV